MQRNGVRAVSQSAPGSARPPAPPSSFEAAMALGGEADTKPNEVAVHSLKFIVTPLSLGKIDVSDNYDSSFDLSPYLQSINSVSW